MKSCPECGSRKLELKASEMLCGKCGLVITQMMYSGSKIIAE